MAEGDSVHRLTRRLNGELKDRTVTAVDARRRSVDCAALLGSKFSEVVPHGKHILMRFAGTKALTLHSHLKMQGRWTHIGVGKHIPKKLDDDVSLILTLDDDSSLVALTMPVLELIESRYESEIVGHLGPDILGPEFDFAAAIARYNQQPQRPIAHALEDQRNVAGLGNVWVVEVMYLRGVYPWKPVREVELKPLLELARKMMLYSRDRQKGMITTGIKRRGETHWVYGRLNRPCRRCGTNIEFAPEGKTDYERATWWCPFCQPQ